MGCCGSSPKKQDFSALPEKKSVTIQPVNFNQRLENIVDFWFQIDDHQDNKSAFVYDRETSLPKECLLRWFKPNQNFDQVVRQKFTEDFDNLDKNLYFEWEKDHYGKLALIILCDQLTRSFYRGTKDTFKYDSIALKISRQLISKPAQYEKYKLIEKLFIIFPFMHSENVQDCETSVLQIGILIDYANSKHYDDVVKELDGLKKSAEQFVNILKTFGRFPHRNQLLDRQNTEEEQQFLKYGNIVKKVLSPEKKKIQAQDDSNSNVVKYGGIEVNRSTDKWKSTVQKIEKQDSTKKRASFKNRKD